MEKTILPAATACADERVIKFLFHGANTKLVSPRSARVDASPLSLRVVAMEKGPPLSSVDLIDALLHVSGGDISPPRCSVQRPSVRKI
jgi:hypothetical protein